MLEVRLDRLGPPSHVARCRPAQEPLTPSAWEALVQIEAFPINPADLAMISGRYGILPSPPCGIGMEAVGRVLQIGTSVEGLEPGDRVLVIANNNWAQKRAVPASLLHVLPESVDPVLVANMKVNAATAYLLIQNFVDLKPGSWIVQNAPLSNVGSTVIQFAKALKLKTLNLVRRPDAIAEVLDMGGDVAVETDEDLQAAVSSNVGRAKIRLALDAVGGADTEALATCCSDRATIVTYGMLSGEASHLRPEHLVFRGLEHKGFWLSKILNRLSHEERSVLYRSIIELIQKIDTPPQPFSFWSRIEDISDALSIAEQGSGKVVVFPNGKPAGSSMAEALPQIPCNEGLSVE